MISEIAYLIKTSNSEYGVSLCGDIKFTGSFEDARDFQKENFKVTRDPDCTLGGSFPKAYKLTVEIPEIYDGPPLTEGIRKASGELVGYFFSSYEFRNGGK